MHLPSAKATKQLEGTKYVTTSRVLPYMYRLIEGSADGMLYLSWKPPGQQWLRASQCVAPQGPPKRPREWR